MRKLQSARRPAFVAGDVMRRSVGCGRCDRVVGRCCGSRRAWLGVIVLAVALGCSALAGAADAATAGPFTFGGQATIDTGAPYGLPAALDTISCPSTGLCVGDTGGFGQIVSSTNPGGTSASDWSQFPTQVAGKAFRYSIGGVSCVMQGTAPFCLATGTDATDSTSGGNAVFLRSTDPAGGASAWQAQRFAPSPPLDVLAPACAAGASTTVCVAGSGSILWASGDAANPNAGGEAGWGTAPFAGFACPTATLCFAAQQQGTVLSSATPGSASSWSSATSSSTGLSSITGFSCPTTTFCIAAGSVAGANRIATSTDPGAATPAWSVSTPPATVTALSCAPDAALSGPKVICFSSNGSTTSVSTDGGATWAAETLASGSSNAFACAGANASLCVAGTSSGQVSTTTSAAQGASATWTSPLLVAPGENPVLLFAQSCPSSGLCVGSDLAGRILTSTNPTSGAGAWSSSLVDPNGGGIYVACASSSACVAFDNNGSVLTSSNPSGGGSTWSAPSTSVDANGISALACPSAGVCVATDLKGNVLTSSTPPFTPASWSAPAAIPGANDFSALACPSRTSCVAFDASGHVYTSTSPPFGATTWSASPSSIDPSTIYQLACPSSSTCIAIDSQGRALTAAAPFSGPNWSAPSSSSIDSANTIQELACPTSSLCVAADNDGNVLTSTTPPFSASTWSTSTVDPFRSITGLACSSNVFCVIADDAGNVLAGTETASNLPGAGPPANPAPTAPATTAPARTAIGAVTPKPSCTIRANSTDVLLPSATKATHKRTTRRPKPGTLSFVVRCNQTATVTLQGKLTALVKANHSRKHSNTFSLPPTHRAAQAGVPVTLTVNLPNSALTALRNHAHASVDVTLTANDVNGTSITTATIRSLKPVATH